MQILVLGQGKTGKLVAEVAAERGHTFRGWIFWRTLTPAH